MIVSATSFINACSFVHWNWPHTRFMNPTWMLVYNDFHTYTGFYSHLISDGQYCTEVYRIEAN